MGNTPTVETGCGTFVADEPTLGVTTRDVSHGGSDTRLYARILTANPEATGDDYVWSEWRHLDNPNCNDRERGETDFYNDFSYITDEWEAIALYNCGTDGWAMDSITFWNGTSSHDGIFEFCDNVAGPSVECYADEIPNSQGTCYPLFGDDNRLYEYLWIDQDNTGCPGITLDIHDRQGRDREVGKLFVQSNPGIPDCSVDNALSIKAKTITDYDGNFEYVFTVSPAMAHIIIGSIIILLLANIFCFGYKNCANRKSKRNKYSKVRQVVSSEDEAHHLNV